MNHSFTPTRHEQRQNLKRLPCVHIPGTLKDFSDWLLREMPNRPSGWDLATARRPELRNINRALTEQQKRALNSITLVSMDSLPHSDNRANSGTIREFYKGYKPRWEDILDGVPSDLDFVKVFSQLVAKGHVPKKLIALIGPAGSGKSTGLMMAALHASKVSNTPVYFLREAVSDIKEVVIALEQINDSAFYLFIDKIEAMHNELSELLSSLKTKNICIVASERLNIWNRRVKGVFSPHISEILNVGKIGRGDANKILEKLEKFGPWTRLQPMNAAQRVDEIFNKADRQLLIGLLEATTGLGFTKIIENDFKQLGDDRHKRFLVIVGLASIHRSTLTSNIVGASLINLGILEDVNVMASETEGIIVTSGKKYSARHPAYVRELFEKVVPTTMIRDCIIAVLEAFSDYDTPVVKNVGKSDGVVFKSVINHRFVKEMMRNDEAKVRSVYEAFETGFHVDGLYWLQYGLALRDFGKQTAALEKLKTAREAYGSPQIEHAYAQQLMIIAATAATWDEAEPLLNEARDVLRDVNRFTDAADTYPIVTLAEGHISVMLRFYGVEGTKETAQRYANELLVAYKKYPNPRLEQAVNNAVTLAATGSWNESYGPGYLDEG